MTLRSQLVFAAALALAALTPGAGSAGPPGQWTQITHRHNGAAANLGLARAKDGTLHVLWAGPDRAPFTAILDTRISPRGVAAKPQPVVSGWVSVNPPAAVTKPDGSIHVVVSGQRHATTDDPNNGLNEIVGPGSWKLGAHAFGNFLITEASNANVRTAVLGSGQLVSVWGTAAKILLQTGVDPSTQPRNITPPNDPVGSAEIAVDQAGGDVVVAYRGASSGTDFLRRVLPTLGAPQPMPQARVDAPPLVARAGGGVFSAYASGAAKVWLERFGAQPRHVPVPKGARVLTAALAAGPDGRLWIFYGNERTTWVTRTSRSTAGFEPVQTLSSPPGAVQYFRLEGEGSAGPLDLFADVTVDGGSRDGSYHRLVHPALSLGASTKSTTNGVQVTVRVTDAGDAVAGAKVTGLPGGAKTTDATGAAVVLVPAGKKGVLPLTASKAGYVPARGRLSL